jgi:hypothetical protein
MTHFTLYMLARWLPVNAVDRAGLDGFLQVVKIIHPLLDGPCPARIVPLHLERLRAHPRAVGTPYAGDLIHEDLYMQIYQCQIFRRIEI